MFSHRAIVVVGTTAFYSWLALKIYRLSRAPYATADSPNAIRSNVEIGESLDLHFFLSHSSRLAYDLPPLVDADNGFMIPQGQKLAHVGSLKVPYSWDVSSLNDRKSVRNDNKWALVSLDPLIEHHMNVTIPPEFRTERPIFMHAAVSRHNTTEGALHGDAVRLSKTISYPQRTDSKIRKFLLPTTFPFMKRLLPRHLVQLPTGDLSNLEPRKLECVPPRILVGLVIEHNAMDANELRSRGFEPFILPEKPTPRLAFPAVINTNGTPRDEYVPLSNDPKFHAASTERPLSLRMTYNPLSFATWNLRLIMSQSLATLENNYNFPAYDIDSLSLLIMVTAPWITGMTVAISVFHMVFEFLAISSDVEFWRERTSFVEFSASALQLEIINEIIINLFLAESGEAKIVRYLLLAKIALNLWKLSKLSDGFKFRLLASSGPPTGAIRSADQKVNVEELSRFESFWMRRLFCMLLPVVAGVAFYRLVFTAQTGWYSWLIHSLALCAYSGGFVGMTPQLFRNYKLKTVDHLPWHALTYQAINTFVDDIFSVLIRMPAMHRMSFFRDDIVFIVYQYQRWLYKKKPEQGEAESVQMTESKVGEVPEEEKEPKKDK